jgi:MFS family permease
MFSGFTFGWAVAALVAMIFIPLFGWRIVLLMGFLPILFLPVLKWLLPESIRFLAGKGRYDEAISELRKVEKGARVTPIECAQPSGSIGQLFTSKLAVMTILVWLTYFFNLLIVYGLATWLPSLLVKAGFSIVRSYSYGLIQAMGASVGGLFLGLLMDRFGRKSALSRRHLRLALRRRLQQRRALYSRCGNRYIHYRRADRPACGGRGDLSDPCSVYGCGMGLDGR